MELNSVLSKLLPALTGTRSPQQIQLAQYLHQGMPFPNALSMAMLRSNHAAHVSRTAHSSHEAFSNFEIQLLHPEIRHLVLPSNAFKSHQGEMKRKKRSAQSKKFDSHHQATVGTVSSADGITPTETVVSYMKAPGGGTIVSSRDEIGQIHVRVEYDRDEMLHFSHSPYAVLPPPCLKNVVMSTPEILSRFPQRHGVDISPSSGMMW